LLVIIDEHDTVRSCSGQADIRSDVLEDGVFLGAHAEITGVSNLPTSVLVLVSHVFETVTVPHCQHHDLVTAAVTLQTDQTPKVRVLLKPFSDSV
jgi:hypothetical protein